MKLYFINKKSFKTTKTYAKIIRELEKDIEEAIRIKTRYEQTKNAWF